MVLRYHALAWFGSKPECSQSSTGRTCRRLVCLWFGFVYPKCSSIQQVVQLPYQLLECGRVLFFHDAFAESFDIGSFFRCHVVGVVDCFNRKLRR